LSRKFFFRVYIAYIYFFISIAYYFSYKYSTINICRNRSFSKSLQGCNSNSLHRSRHITSNREISLRAGKWIHTSRFSISLFPPFMFPLFSLMLMRYEMRSISARK